MIIINNVKLSLDTDFDNLIPVAAKQLKIRENDIVSATLHRKSVDARRKSDVHFCCSIKVETTKNKQKILKNCKNANTFCEKEYVWERADFVPQNRPVIVGFGPAGIFAALVLARAGLTPLVIERGEDVDKRTRTVEAFFSGGEINVNSNVQFGEGGAGTFSDGKLNTGIKDPRCREILKIFSEFGADKNILTDAKPHIGTDVLKEVVKNIREEIILCGGEVRFNSRLEDIVFEDKTLKEIIVNGKKIPCDDLILSIGHSARDTFKMLYKNGVSMERKPFAMGVRIEHLQSDINKALYGVFAEHPALKAADYKMAVHLESGRGVYTFCMCPGGEVVNASSEKCALAVNGMSYSGRDGDNANSAIIVSVTPEDFGSDHPLAGIAFQRSLEEKAYKLGDGKIPAQRYGEFKDKVSCSDISENDMKEDCEIRDGGSKLMPCTKGEYVWADVSQILPNACNEAFVEGMEAFGRQIKGFDRPDAILLGVESRTSSPVRIHRDVSLQSQVMGLYPCGEGAGYAGGITSAAMDGVRVAEMIATEFNRLT